MGIVAKKQSGNRFFVNAPTGMQHAVCVDIIDLGIVTPTNPQHKPAHKVKFLFQLKRTMTEKAIIAAKKANGDNSPLTDGEKKLVGQRYLASQKFTLSLHEKALLRKSLVAWRGEDFSDAELNAGFDVENMIGENVFLNIVPNEYQGKTYANIQSYGPFDPEEFGEPIKPENYIRVQDREKTGEHPKAGAGGLGESDDDGNDDIPFND